MQIREMTLKELYPIHNLVKELYPTLSYEEFENLIYDMREINYKMIGLLEKDELISYAGISILTSFKYKRHIYIFEFVTYSCYQNRGFGSEMLEFLIDYAKMSMCENIVISTTNKNTIKFLKHKSFVDNGEFIFKI